VGSLGVIVVAFLCQHPSYYPLTTFFMISAFGGYRERLHGHNYTIGVRLLGSRKIANDGYVVDFGNIKTVTRKVCKELNEHFLCPMLSDVIEIKVAAPSSDTKQTVTLTCQDGSTFAFPKDDCAMLPIVHTTAEELAIYLWSRILEGLDADYLLQRGIHTMEVVVAEAVGQEATFRLEIPEEGLKDTVLDVRAFIMEGKVKPMPCPSAALTKTQPSVCVGKCESCQHALSSKLQRLAEALNTDNHLKEKKEITMKDLEDILAGTESP
jgi:6-pyruvoyl-tetrahydropterin synthase